MPSLQVYLIILVQAAITDCKDLSLACYHYEPLSMVGHGWDCKGMMYDVLQEMLRNCGNDRISSNVTADSMEDLEDMFNRSVVDFAFPVSWTDERLRLETIMPGSALFLPVIQSPGKKL